MLETELPFWPTVLKYVKVVSNVITPPPLLHKRASMCNMSTTAASYMDSWTLVASSLKIVRNVLPPLGMKRACATYMPTTATGEMLKKEHAAVTWKKSSPPRGVGPTTTTTNNNNNSHSHK